jgi:hypothetical protein
MEKCEFTLCSEPAIQEALVDLAFIRVCRAHFETISSRLRVQDHSYEEIEDDLIVAMGRLDGEDLALVETGTQSSIRAKAFVYQNRGMTLEQQKNYEAAAMWQGKALLLLKSCVMDQLVVKVAYRLGYLLCLFLGRPEEGIEKLRLSYQLSLQLAPSSEHTYIIANFFAQNLMETFQTAEAREVLTQTMDANPDKESECFLRAQMLLSWSFHLHGEEWTAELLMLRTADVVERQYPASMLLAQVYFYLIFINKPQHPEATGGGQLYLDCCVQVVQKCKVSGEGLLLALYFALLHPKPAGFRYRFGKGMGLNVSAVRGKLAALCSSCPKTLWNSPLGAQVHYLFLLLCSHCEAIPLAQARIAALQSHSSPALAQELLLYCRTHTPWDGEASTYLQQALSIYTRLKGVRAELLHQFNALELHFVNWSEDLPYLDPLLERARRNLDSELGLQATVIKVRLYNKYAGALKDFPAWVASALQGSHTPLYACTYVSDYVNCHNGLGTAIRLHFFSLVKPLLTRGIASVLEASCLLAGARMLSKPNMLRAFKVVLRFLKQHCPQSILTAYSMLELAVCSAGPLASASASQAYDICMRQHSGAECSMLVAKAKTFFSINSEKRVIMRRHLSKLRELYPGSKYLFCALMEQTVTEAQTGGTELVPLLKETFNLYWQLLPCPRFELPFFGRLAKAKVPDSVKPGLIEVLNYCVEHAPITCPVGIFTYVMKCCRPGRELPTACESFVQRCRQASVKPKKMVEALAWQGDILMACNQSIQAVSSYREACTLIQSNSLQQEYLPVLIKEVSSRQAPIPVDYQLELLQIVKQVYVKVKDPVQAFNLSQMQAASKQFAQAEESYLPEFTPQGFLQLELSALYRIYRDLQLP